MRKSVTTPKAAPLYIAITLYILFHMPACGKKGPPLPPEVTTPGTVKKNKLPSDKRPAVPGKAGKTAI